ncbi:MAG: alpha/beta hydrolase [Alphaproteobacteria bacterium]
MSGSCCLALVHGWGSDDQVWEPLRTLLPDMEIETFDLGFFGRPRRPEMASRERVIAVGHSLGFLWLLHERPWGWRALISIGGFSRFTRAPDFPEGVEDRILSRMTARLREDPARVVEEFRERCGCPGHGLPPHLDTERLGQGLGWLAEWDERDALAAERCPVLALFAYDDAVVPPMLSERVFASRRSTVVGRSDHGGHALPVTRPEWCAERIRWFAETLP